MSEKHSTPEGNVFLPLCSKGTSNIQRDIKLLATYEYLEGQDLFDRYQLMPSRITAAHFHNRIREEFVDNIGDEIREVLPG